MEPIRDQRELVVELVGSFCAGLGGNDRGSNYHSDKAESNQQIMHCAISSWNPMEPVHTCIIGGVGKNLNSTKTVSFRQLVLCQYHLWGIAA